jgi:GntR family transcriptional regulator
MSLVYHTRNARATRPAGAVSRLASRFTEGVPLYLQIAESLLNEIESGGLRPGARLPAERLLSETLGVNRMTLRAALTKLASEGYLDRRQGSGTFVARPKIERQAGRLVPFSRTMIRYGYRPGAKVVALERRPAPAAIARQLRVPVSSALYLVRRVRLVNREPVMLETFWMPVRRFPGFERFDITRRSVFEIMETEYGVRVRRARQSLEPAIATEFEARLLNVAPGAALMLEERLSFDTRGRPIEYGKDVYRGDRFRFVTDHAPLDR